MQEAFSGPLEFGTAGLRGILGAGESLMNLAVVLRTTLGLGTYLLERPELQATQRGVIIGYDGRHKSHLFAVAAAEVLCARNIPVKLATECCPTPLVAFACKHEGAAAGIMVTASHNPPEYNGYKVYWENAAQIISPIDEEIAKRIEAAPVASLVPRVGRLRAEGLWQDLSASTVEAYLAAVGALSVKPGGKRDISIVYTPMHGVGWKLAHEALTRAGFSRVVVVPQQAEPDPDFPTVRFPNPEEPGALDLAKKTANMHAANLILANDPDADRLAACARTRTGSFVQLTGNQVGMLLADYLLRHTSGDKRLVISSCVSSPMLGVIAEKHGVRHAETLTGFKWIANRALALAKENYTFVFGFEEALGYTVSTAVRDKDGIGAAVVFAEMAAHLAQKDETVLDELERLARAFGAWVSRQKSITLPGQDGKEKMAMTMARLRNSPPDELAGRRVVSMTDILHGTRLERGVMTRIGLPPSDVLSFGLEAGERVMVRPSGTEPKIKFYFDLAEPVSPTEAVSAAEARGLSRIAALEQAVVRLSGAVEPS